MIDSVDARLPIRAIELAPRANSHAVAIALMIHDGLAAEQAAKDLTYYRDNGLD